jgi:hypothetical protein
MTDPFVFHRPDLAKRLADMALGLDPLGDGSGVFLAAPRRTGKSTFLKADLIPELRDRGALPVYVDLWVDRARDPGEIILEAIKAAIRQADSGVMKLVRRSGLSKVGVGSWLAVDIDKIGKPGGATITEAVAHLVQKSAKPVVLIVDEAQHATTSAAGANAMFALKSARDTLNIGAERSAVANVQIGLVFTGSHRDKLASLVLGKSQPFFGATVTAFPLLGKEFAKAYADYVNERLLPERRLNSQEVFDAFETSAFRPELLQAAVKNYLLGDMGSKKPLQSLREHAVAAREKYWAEFDSIWSSMTELQKAVLKRLVEQGDNYKPFDAEALEVYSTGTGQKVTTPDAQSALDSLREKGLVVRLERGRYTLDDDSVGDWLASRFPAAPSGLSDGPG